MKTLLVSLVLLGPAAALAAEWDVWTVQETRRVLREVTAGEGRAVTLHAARNEAESFQILLRAKEAIPGVNLAAGTFRRADGTALAGAEVTLYRQHQFLIEQGTYRNDRFCPGWYPDALIPFVHPVTGKPLAGGRYQAVPFDLPAGETHGFWVDVYVPAEATPGDYAATFQVTAANGLAAEVPVTLTVWNFALPATPAMATALGSPLGPLRASYGQQPPADATAVEAQVNDLLRRHRINATPPNGLLVPAAGDDGRFEIAAEQIDQFRQFVDRYHINAFQVRHPEVAVKDPVAEKDRLLAWLAAFDRAAQQLDRPGVVLYTYLLDEPNDADAYRYVQTWGKVIKEADSVVKVLVVEQTATQDPAWGDLYGAVDIWCPLFSLFDAETAAARQAQGETLWTYTALCQGQKTPWWHTDFPLLHYRVPASIAWRYRIRGLLYWGGLAFWKHVEDPWTQPWTYDLRKENPKLVYNGEGSIVYPGRPCGYDGIAPSLRLKALRDAIDDYDYLALLEARGQAAAAEQVVVPLAESWYAWQEDPAAWESARRKLGEMLQQP